MIDERKLAEILKKAHVFSQIPMGVASELAEGVLALSVIVERLTEERDEARRAHVRCLVSEAWDNPLGLTHLARCQKVALHIYGAAEADRLFPEKEEKNG